MPFKMNTIKYDLTSYPQYVIMGERGIGKTTFFRDLVIKVYGSAEAGLLISCGGESGYHALDNLQVEEAREWTKELGYPEKDDGVPEEEWTRGFVEIIDDLVFNKNQYKIKLVCFDTADELYKMAEARVMTEQKNKNGSYPESINAALGGYGRGPKRAIDLVVEQKDRLLAAGYGVFIISHVKIKDKVDPLTGDVYEQYTNNMNGNYFSAIADSAQMVVNIVNEMNIAGGQTLDKNGKKTAGKVESATRMMYFRQTGLVDAKSRFPQLPEKLPLSVDSFMEAFKEGVKNAHTITPVPTAKEIETHKKKEQEVASKKYKEVIDKEETNDSRREELVSNIKAMIKTIIGADNKSSVDALQKILVSADVQNLDVLKNMKITDLISLSNKITKIK